MKKLLYFFAAMFAAVIIGSCGQTEKGDSVDSDSIRMADSLAGQARRDSIEWVGFSSKDLVFFGLHGHVKAMLYNGTVYQFDSLGNWTKIDDVSPYGRKVTFDDYYSVFSHDKNGFITNEEFWEGGTEFVWKDGRIVGENSFNCAYECRLSYEYDSLGNIGAATMVESDDAGDSWSKPSKIVYTYKAFDTLRNWTVRKSVNGTDRRFLIYYDMPAADNKKDTAFNPWRNQYVFTGSIGREKKCPLAISPNGGIYTVASGTRNTGIVSFDEAKGLLTVEARIASDEKKLGEFVGTVTKAGDSQFRYKGTFTNTSGGKVDFNLVSL